MSLATPVAFIIFNRPDVTKIVFEAIRQAKPKKLLVVADGPRNPAETEKCRESRACLEKVDWDCEVLTNFSEKNLGCKLRVSSGLDWVFSQVEEAIILEDDCLPSPSFFPYCQNLLERYRHDERVMMINGTSLDSSIAEPKYTYYFTKYSQVWGWASWRRAWQHYDVDMKSWPEFSQSGLLASVCEDPLEVAYWTERFDRVYAGKIDTWDYQWTYACWTQHGLFVQPMLNMVSNLGIGHPDATHTRTRTNLAELPLHDLQQIIHFPFMVRNVAADRNTFDNVYGGNSMIKSATPVQVTEDGNSTGLKRKIIKVIKRALGRN